MESKHTKGEWYDTFDNNERGVRNTGGFICFLPKPFHYPLQDERYEIELEENKANAKLISAAPKLLECLIEFVDWIKQGDYEQSFIEDAEQAIKKATE
jgi:hypothetical protein